MVLPIATLKVIQTRCGLRDSFAGILFTIFTSKQANKETIFCALVYPETSSGSQSITGNYSEIDYGRLVLFPRFTAPDIGEI